MENEKNVFESELNGDDFKLNISDEDIERAEALKEEITTIEQEQRMLAEIENLKAQISEKNENLQLLEERFLREQAEVENFKRRMREESQQKLKYASQQLITDLLPVLDGFTNAFSQVEKTDQNAAFFAGFEMVQGQLVQALSSAGLEEIDTSGKFDPQWHQAIMTDTVETLEDDAIIDTLMKGYKLHDRVLRASMVKVNKK